MMEGLNGKIEEYSTKLPYNKEEYLAMVPENVPGLIEKI